MSVAKFMNERPFSVLAILVALRGLFVGFGYATSQAIFVQGRLWEILDQFVFITPQSFGIGLMLLNILIIVAFLLTKDRLVQAAGYSMTLGYLFIAAAYLTGGEWLALLTNGLIWVALIGFLTYSHLNRGTWVDPKSYRPRT